MELNSMTGGNDIFGSGSGSSGEEFQSNNSSQLNSIPQNQFQMQPPQYYPNPQIQQPQYQIPPQPIYPQPQGPSYPPNNQNNVSYSSTNYSNTPQNNMNYIPPNTSSNQVPNQDKILVNDIEKDTILNKNNIVCQIIMMVYLFTYAIGDIIYQLVENIVNMSTADDIMMIILAIIILIFNLKGRTASHYFLVFYCFIVWFVGMALKLVGYTTISNGSISLFVLLLIFIRFIALLIIVVATCPPSFMKRRGRKFRKKIIF